MKKQLLLYWRDPVLSKVIATFLSGAALFVIALFIDISAYKTAILTVFIQPLELWKWLAISISVLLTYLLVKKLFYFKYDESKLALDKQLFERIKNDLLPKEKVIGWLREYDFGCGFKYKKLRELFRIEEESKNPDFEFLHPRLEKKRKELVEAVEAFSPIMSSYIFGNGNHLLSIPSEWEFEQPERFRKALHEISKGRERVCVAYDAFIKFGRRTLKV